MREDVLVHDVSVEVESLWLSEGWWSTAELLNLINWLALFKHDLRNELLQDLSLIVFDFLEHT